MKLMVKTRRGDLQSPAVPVQAIANRLSLVKTLRSCGVLSLPRWGGRFRRLPLWLFLYFITGCLVPANANEVQTIELTDPVCPEEAKRQHTLSTYLDAEGFPSGYSMDLVNKVCLDDVCKLVEVTLYWDAMGFYQRLEYAEHQPLTKLEHDPFTPADYEKLDSILKDRGSILNDHSLGFLATENNDADSAEEDDLDGVSKATPGAVKEAVVKDAAWTTWVLWKYANTEIVAMLQAMTESRCSPEYLQHLLDSKDWRKIEFAINYLLKQKPVTHQYLDKVATLLPSADIDHIELAIEYIQQASPDKNTGYRKLIGALGALDEYNAGLVIELLESDEQLEGEILEELTSSIEQQDYYPVHLALRLVESRKFFSQEVEADIVKLLQSKDFFIARRASEFLSGQKLSSSNTEKLEAFREENASRL
ncbi:MAG: hypothetical protein GY762_02520 [Proteobacteria bacterium]|nr:hypothetical protein [Pseudomonadota bacterium]